MSLVANEKTACSLQASLDNVLPFAWQKYRQGHRVCLVTIVNVEGVSPRPLGSQFVVAENGESFGMLTGGCAEDAIRQEALKSLQRNKSQVLRVGADSPWIDIRLPCGSGIDLHFSILDSEEVIANVCGQIVMRKEASIQLDVSVDRWTMVEPHAPTAGLQNGTFTRSFQPSTRLTIFGSGEYVLALSRLAIATGIKPTVWSPSEETVNFLSKSLFDPTDVHQHRAHQLHRNRSLEKESFDRWTAAVLLFHEHDWEPRLLKSVLDTDCFYVGALGSRKTHADRIKSLRKLGISEAQIKRVHGPVGLPILARTPEEIAISILAEIVQAKNQRLSDE